MIRYYILVVIRIETYMHGNIKDLFIYLFYTYTLKSRIKDLEEKNMLTWYIFEKGIKFS